jgi:hypothetical protein
MRRFVALLTLLIPGCSTAWCAEDLSGFWGNWRVVHVRVAPWAGPAAQALPSLPSLPLSLTPRHVHGPFRGLNCAKGARSELLPLPAEGLFEGNLPQPAAQAAQDLGFRTFPVATLRVVCPNSTADYHRLDADTLVLGYDNLIWTLKRP